MSRYGDEEERDMPPAYAKIQSNHQRSTKRGKKTGSGDDTDTGSCDDRDTKTSDAACKMWLQVLPSRGGLLLAVLLAEIMAEGMTPTQMNILGNFISAVGSLISYKASRDEIDFP
jgi:hypothetical protein